MQTRVQIASTLFALLCLGGTFELVRRRRLGERYALLWMLAALFLLVLAVWKWLLFKVSHAVGIYYPPNAFFAISIAFALLLLMHFSIACSRLADQTRVLAQRVALLEAELRERDRPGNAGAAAPAPEGTGTAGPARDRDNVLAG